MELILASDSICLSHFLTEVEVHHLNGIGGLKLQNDRFYLPRDDFLNIRDARKIYIHHYVVGLQSLHTDDCYKCVMQLSQSIWAIFFYYYFYILLIQPQRGTGIEMIQTTLTTIIYVFFTVFGNTGLHLILRGSVVSESLQAISPIDLDQDRRDFFSPSPILEEDKLQSVKEQV